MNDSKPHEVAVEALGRFLAGRVTDAERTTIVRHLLARCATCYRHLHASASLSPFRGRPLPDGHPDTRSIPAGGYDEAFAAAQRRVNRELERRQRALNSLLAELDRMPAAEQEMKVRNSRRFASSQLAYALVQRSHEKRHDDPAAMLHFARLAVAAVEGSTATAAGSQALLHDCRAQAWGQLANAHRVRAELDEAERAFATALHFLQVGTGEASLRARLLSQTSSLRTYQRRFPEAVGLLEEAAALYRGLDDRVGEAEALTNLGTAQFGARQLEAAIPPLNRALSLLGERKAALQRAAILNLAACYNELGLPRLACAFVPILEKHFSRCTDEVNLLRFDWLRGLIERDLDLLMSAELRLSWAREGFLAKRLPFESALISLDLAEVYVQQRRLPEAMRTVGEAVPILEGLGVARDLLAALLKLRELAGQRQAAVALLRRVAAAVRGGEAQAAP